MLVVCLSNRPREPRDEGSSAGCALKPNRFFLHTSDILGHSSPSASTRIEAHDNPSHQAPSLLPLYLPFLHYLLLSSPSFLYTSFLMSPRPYMIDKYCCCLLPAFRYELGPLRRSI
jgi:hypothetical protein